MPAALVDLYSQVRDRLKAVAKRPPLQISDEMLEKARSPGRRRRQ
jgi:hypothetical protein